MNTPHLVALLISTYNWPEALEVVLQSVLSQRTLPDEILIADDGSGQQTFDVIENFKKITSIPVKHVWHTDDGFRKTIIMNRAIKASICDYIIQIDGDIVLHPSFVRDHIREAEKGFYIKGSRTLLDKKRTEFILSKKTTSVSILDSGQKNRINSLYLPFLAPLLRRKQYRSDDLRGCNCAFWKSDFIHVNGYNNSLKGWGHEDIELAARLINAGLMQKRIKLEAVCYHLYHEINKRDQESENFVTYENVVKERTIRAINGYEQVIK